MIISDVDSSLFLENLFWSANFLVDLFFWLILNLPYLILIFIWISTLIFILKFFTSILLGWFFFSTSSVIQKPYEKPKEKKKTEFDEVIDDTKKIQKYTKEILKIRNKWQKKQNKTFFRYFTDYFNKNRE